MARRRGRPLAPIKTLDRRVGQLADALRQARLRVGLSRPELAVKVGRSVTTIHRAEAGQVRVPWPLTRDIAMACHMDLDTVERMWRQAGRPGHTRLTEAPRVSLILTNADLAAALRRVWEENGEPSLRTMEARAEVRAQEREYAPLSRMSAWRLRERKQAVTSLNQLYAYLTGCAVPEEDFPAWARAWHRAIRSKEPVPWRPGALTSIDEHRTILLRRPETLMLEAGLVAVDPFPGPGAPWAARCRPCGKLSRFVFSEVIEGTSRCPACRRYHSVLARDQEPLG